MSAHTCHWSGCKRVVPPAMWGFRQHWFSLPAAIRNDILATYRPTQEYVNSKIGDGT